MTENPNTPAQAGSMQAADPRDNAAQASGDIEHLSYEQARAQLVEVVQRLEAGGAGLEESLALWERGEALARRCESWLAGARARLDAARDQAGPDAMGSAGSPS